MPKEEKKKIWTSPNKNLFAIWTSTAFQYNCVPILIGDGSGPSLPFNTQLYIYISKKTWTSPHKKLQYRRLCNYTSMNVVLLSIGDGSGALQHTIIFMYYIIITIWVKELLKEMYFS